MIQSVLPILQKTDAYKPSMVVLDNGNLLFVYSANDQDKRGVWAKILDPDGNPILDLTGNPIDTEFQVNETVLGYQSVPEVTVLENGSLVVTWLSGTSLGTGDVFGHRLDAEGNLIGTEFAINPNSTANYSREAETTALSDGGFVTVWYEYHSDSSLRSIFGQVYDANYDVVGSQFLAPDPLSYNQTEAEVLALDGGGFVITWSGNNGLWGSDTSGGIYGQMYGATGAEFGVEFHVNTTVQSEQHHSKMVALPDGGFMVLWQDDAGTNTLRFQQYDAVGATVGVEGALATTVSLNYLSTEWEVITLSGGGIGVMWQTTNGDLYVQSFTTDGTAITEFVLIDTPNGSDFTADLGQLPDGRLIVTWEDEPLNEIYTQTIDAPTVVNGLAAIISAAQLSDSFVFDASHQQDQIGESLLPETLALELDDSVETPTQVSPEDVAFEVSLSHVMNSFVPEPDPFEF